MISGVVLAAGTSTRMGRPKQLLDLGGRPLLQHALDVAAESFDEVVLVLGHEAEAVEAALTLASNVRIVVNPDYASGQQSSVCAGLAAVRSAEAAAILLGDQPGMSGALIDEVVGAFRASGAGVVRPGTPEAPAHPVLVGRSALDRLVASPGDVPSVLRGPGVEFVATSAALPEDVDTPEDYDRLRTGAPRSQSRRSN